MAEEYIQGGKEMTETTWAFNMDTACVESRRPDGSVIAIDTLAVEREFVETWLDRRELDYLIYNDPIGYAKLVWEECPEEYLKTATDYTKLSDLR